GRARPRLDGLAAGGGRGQRTRSPRRLNTFSAACGQIFSTRATASQRSPYTESASPATSRLFPRPFCLIHFVASNLFIPNGGEEFACLLPDTDADDARALAEALLAEVRAMGIPHRQGGDGGVLTASMGVATRRGPAHPGWQPALLLGLADAQLYEAKRLGRARVCAAVLGQDD
ncbi:diguanylate cyclase domain-containing protein, partial [Tepidimonas ignava]|uniref:diguanylate cyclase domain-containing protein n=1 Tax=Tepidimonas ignava TaxID=114249 RepID=UPI002FDB81E4